MPIAKMPFQDRDIGSPLTLNVFVHQPRPAYLCKTVSAANIPYILYNLVFFCFCWVPPRMNQSPDDNTGANSYQQTSRPFLTLSGLSNETASSAGVTLSCAASPPQEATTLLMRFIHTFLQVTFEYLLSLLHIFCHVYLTVDTTHIINNHASTLLKPWYCSDET